VQTGSLDPSRYPFTYQKTQEELLKEQPQIFEFLKTTFSCIAVGYKTNTEISYLVPPQPPQIHSFVTVANADLYRVFFAKHQYLHLLFSAAHSNVHVDELLLAIFNQLLALEILSRDHLAQVMRTYLLLANNDYRRMKLFLDRLKFS
jgi:hypothetical protein